MSAAGADQGNRAMLKKIENMNYYELLEVTPSATKQEIHKAYERIRRVYEPNSLALYSLFTAEESANMHQRIEEAYRTLVYEDNRKVYDTLLRNRTRMDEMPSYPPPPKFQPKPIQPTFTLPSENRYISKAEPTAQPRMESSLEPQESKPQPITHVIAEFTGPAIKSLREHLGLTIRNVADTTKVGSRYLENIEAEGYGKLPARPYLRGFLGLYAKALGCDPERMVNDYMKRYDAAIAAK
jgi:curved DNA-binding protein CbpA